MLGAGCVACVLYSPSCLNSFGVLCGAMCRMFGHLHHQAAAVCVCSVLHEHHEISCCCCDFLARVV